MKLLVYLANYFFKFELCLIKCSIQYTYEENDSHITKMSFGGKSENRIKS